MHCTGLLDQFRIDWKFLVLPPTPSVLFFIFARNKTTTKNCSKLLNCDSARNKKKMKQTSENVTNIHSTEGTKRRAHTHTSCFGRKHSGAAFNELPKGS